MLNSCVKYSRTSPKCLLGALMLRDSVRSQSRRSPGADKERGAGCWLWVKCEYVFFWREICWVYSCNEFSFLVGPIHADGGSCPNPVYFCGSKSHILQQRNLLHVAPKIRCYFSRIHFAGSSKMNILNTNQWYLHMNIFKLREQRHLKIFSFKRILYPSPLTVSRQID